MAVIPMEKTVSFGGNATFTCSAEGGPGNTFTWLKDGASIPGETLETLFLEDINATIHGGNYTCVVNNTAGSDSASAVLNVDPVVIKEPLDREIVNGTLVSFMFVVEAFPPPTYEWIFVGGELDERAMGVNSNTLVLDPAVFGNEGDYRCTAVSNGVIVMSRNTTLSGNCQN